VVEAYGEVDELNSALGLVRTACDDAATQQLLERLQSELFTVGAELACVPEKRDRLGIALIDDSAIASVETTIDQRTQELEPMREFILPGGCEEASFLHLARTVCRRAERRVVGLGEDNVRGEVLRYLNRLADLLFVLARDANRRANVKDVPWRGVRKSDPA
jgi:cob(I)alamin adenosyltransferase